MNVCMKSFSKVSMRPQKSRRKRTVVFSHVSSHFENKLKDAEFAIIGNQFYAKMNWEILACFMTALCFNPEKPWLFQICQPTPCYSAICRPMTIKFGGVTLQYKATCEVMQQHVKL